METLSICLRERWLLPGSASKRCAKGEKYLKNFAVVDNCFYGRLDSHYSFKVMLDR